MDELSSRSKGLLDEFKADATPGPEAIESALRSAQAGGPAGPSTAGMSLAGKLAIVGFVGVVVAVGLWLTGDDSGDVVATAHTASVVPAVEAAVPETAPEPEQKTTAAPAPVEEAPTPTAKPATPGRRSPPETGGAAPVKSATATPADDDLVRQMKLMADARRALKADDPQRAHALLGRYAREFPGGSFAEQAAALEVDALCGLGRDDQAEAAARKFAKRWPSSPSAARVRQACSARN